MHAADEARAAQQEGAGMSLHRYAKRRDSNEAAIEDAAEKLGWWLIQTDQPGDFIGWFRGHWEIIEVKDPKVEGHADEFTPAQQKFHEQAKCRGAKVLVWREVQDVINATRARTGGAP